MKLKLAIGERSLHRWFVTCGWKIHFSSHTFSFPVLEVVEHGFFQPKIVFSPQKVGDRVILEYSLTRTCKPWAVTH